MLIETKISLMLNRREGDHQRLLKMTDQLLKMCMNTSAAPDALVLSQEMGTYVELSQDNLKREWDRLKRGR